MGARGRHQCRPGRKVTRIIALILIVLVCPDDECWEEKEKEGRESTGVLEAGGGQLTFSLKTNKNQTELSILEIKERYLS
jgi:hypothetical protein